MRAFFSPQLFTLLAICLAAESGSTAESSKAFVQRGDRSDELVLGNSMLELHFRPALCQLVNKLSGRSIPVTSDDFSIGIEGKKALQTSDFVRREPVVEDTADGLQVAFPLDNAAVGVSLRIVYTLGNRDPFARRRLEATLDQPLALRQIDVWRVGTAGKASHQGFGEPVLMEDTFWGLEFPGGHNAFAEGAVRLAHFPGRTVPDRFTSKPAVVGVAEAGGVVRRFHQYLETIQDPGNRMPLFVNYNTWWTLMPPTEQNCLELIDTFKRKLADPYGESIDTFTIDDGWDNKESIWAIRKDRFPRGFAPLVEALKGMNCQLGLWLSPSSGYSHAPWGAANGYDPNSNPWFLCQSGEKYRRDIVKAVTDLAREYRLAFYKFDGFAATCDAEGHAHLPGPYAQEANIDAFIELMEAVRRVRPDIYLDPTCGMWLSPWWLQYANSLWGNVSGDYPDIIVPAPVLRDSATTTRDAVFRQRCREHPGYPPSAIEHLGIIVITPEKWEDNAIAVVGRGCRLLTLYIDPKFFSAGDRDWAFLASVLKWVRHHAKTLRHTELILGDPMLREPYGYAHFGDARGILALRNPSIEPQDVEICLDETAGWRRDPAGPRAAGEDYVARIIYPRHETLPRLFHYGDTFKLTLDGYETLLLNLDPVGSQSPVLLGARCREIGREASRIRYAVYGSAGETRQVSIAGSLRVENVCLDENRLSLTQTPGIGQFAVSFDGPQQQCRIEGGKLQAGAPGMPQEILGGCLVEVPAGVRSTMYLLADAPQSSPARVQCAARVNGRNVEVRRLGPAEKRAGLHSEYPWAWFMFDLPAGRNEVSVAIRPDGPQAFFRGKLGWSLSTERPLSRRTLTVQFDGPLPAAVEDPLPLPIGMEVDRHVVTLHAPSRFRLGDPWPAGERVRLDAVAPDEFDQDWGKLMKNQSVWEKEMVVAGQKFACGLGMHANGRVVYDLSGGGFRSFHARVGRDEHAGDGKIIFQVWQDGKKVFDSGVMTRGVPAKPVDVDVSGASVLELRALDGGDGISGDHADWAEAELRR